MTPVKVGELNRQIKGLLESHFTYLSVEGEISNLTIHTSGHVYFSLKDDEGSIRCVMFKGNAAKLKFRLENGLKVVLDCGLTVYPPRGEYQLTVSSVSPAGKGSLALALEQLKQKLSEKGYFNPAIKKQLPKFPKNVALITSSTGAALQDILRVAEKRWTLTKFTIFNTLVQGDGAGAMIAENIAVADSKNYDVIILARGGGSIEDLWAFNEEVVADAIFAAKTPILTGIGHEIDFTIADFVSDLRAPTPSAAMETLLPDKNEVSMYIDSVFDGFVKTKEAIVSNKIALLKHITELFGSYSPLSKLKLQEEQIVYLKSAMEQKIDALISKKTADINPMYESFRIAVVESLSQKERILNRAKDGFEAKNPDLVFDDSAAMIVKKGKKSSTSKIKVGDEFEIQGKKEIIKAKALEKTKI